MPCYPPDEQKRRDAQIEKLIARGVQRLRGRVRADPALTKLFGDHLWRLDGKPTAPPPRPRIPP